VCGAITRPVDIDDLDLNPYIVCCSECRSIVQARNEWTEVYTGEAPYWLPPTRSVETTRWLYDQAIREG
jgi:hypothetical protein